MSTSTDPVRQRMAAANPARTEAEPPGEVMTTAVLLDMIDDRSGAMAHKLDSQEQGTLVATRHVRRNWAAAFAASFVVVLIVGIAMVLLNRGGGPPDVIAPAITTTPTSVPDATPPAAVGVLPESSSPDPIDETPGIAVADGSLWAATDAGIVRWDLAERSAVLFTSADGLPFSDGSSGGIAVAPDGAVWAFTWNQDLAMFDGTEWSEPTGYDQIDIVNPRCVSGEECLNPVTAMAVGPDGVLFLALGDGALAEFDGVEWTIVPDTPADSAVDMAVAADGTLWVAGWDEVLTYDGDTWGRFTANDGLPSGAIDSVDVAPNGDIWVGTTDFFEMDPSGGVARFDGDSWVVFDETDGLYDNSVTALAVGPGGTVWAVHGSTDNPGAARDLAAGGVSRFDGTAWSATAITDVGAGFGSGGAAVDDTGTLWITSRWGVVGFDGAETTVLRVPEGTRPVIEAPHVVIEGGEDILATTVAKATPSVATCPAGSDPNGPGPVDQARPLEGYGSLTAMDRQSGRVVGLALYKAQTWAFNVCTNTWTLMSRSGFPLTQPSALVYDADSDLVVAIGAFVDAYDVDTDTWERHGETPLDNGPETDSEARAIYDPVSGLIVIRDIVSSEMWAYDVDTDTWTQIRQGPISPPGTEQAISSEEGHIFFAQLHAYDTSTDRIVLYLADDYGGPGVWDGAGTEMTWTFDLRAGEWTIEDTVTPELGVGAYFSPFGKAAYDEVAERTVITGDGVVGGYDSARHEWEILWESSSEPNTYGMGTGPHHRAGDTIVYDPTNDRIIVIGGGARLLDEDPFWVSMDDVWTFDARTGTWFELLAPSNP